MPPQCESGLERGGCPLPRALPILSRGEDEDFLIHEIRNLAEKIGGPIALKDIFFAVREGDRNEWETVVDLDGATGHLLFANGFQPGLPSPSPCPDHWTGC